jgi:prevent-host-death family protein
MEKKIGSAEVRRKFGQLLEEVYYHDDTVVVELRGRPMATLVPLELYESWQVLREQFFALIEDARRHNQDLKPEVLEKEIGDAIRAIQQGE